jgi:uncharacterized OsmC-like protein
MYSVEVVSEKSFEFRAVSGRYEFNIDIEGKAVSPPALLLASLASCVGVYIRKYAQGFKLDLRPFSVRASAEFAKTQPICFKDIDINIDLKDNHIDEKAKESLLRFIKNCPVHNTLKSVPTISIKLISCV